MIAGAALAAANHLLKQATWARQRLAAHAGRKAELALHPFTFEFQIDGSGYLVRADAGASDVRVEFPADAPLQLLRGREEVMRSTRISGAADFAECVGFVLRNLDWDAEEDLARIFGDIAARRLARGLSAAFAWQRQAMGNLAENFGEYAAYEAALLVPRAEAERHTAAVRQLAEAIDRAEARLTRLART